MSALALSSDPLSCCDALHFLCFFDNRHSVSLPLNSHSVSSVRSDSPFRCLILFVLSLGMSSHKKYCFPRRYRYCSSTVLNQQRRFHQIIEILKCLLLVVNMDIICLQVCPSLGFASCCLLLDSVQFSSIFIVLLSSLLCL